MNILTGKLKPVFIVLAIIVVLFVGHLLISGIADNGIKKTYFNTNGSVNTQVVSNVLAHTPAQAKSSFLSSMNNQINSAVSKGTITQAQSKVLKQDFGIQQ